MSRVLGIDYGDRRIGLAVSDPMRMIASARSVIQQAGQKTIDQIVRLCREEEIGQIVVGLPLNMDGSSGQAVAKVRAFVAALEAGCPLPVALWDERLSTVTAQKAMRNAGTKARKQRGTIDKVAAQIILQSWLDAQSDTF